MHTPDSLTLADDLERNARLYPHKTAFVYEDRRLTHAQFLDRAKRLASALHKSMAKRQDRISILAQNCMQFIEIYGACEFAGFIATTINFRLAAPEMAYIIKDSAPRVLFFESAYTEIIGQLRSDLTSVSQFVCIPDGTGHCPDWATNYETFIQTGEAHGPPYRAQPDDILYLIYTSGTTGRPKGCMHRHPAVRSWAQLMSIAHNQMADERALLMMPFFHVGAKFVQVSLHALGSTVFIQRGFDLDSVLQCIAREKITLTHMAPMMVQSLLESTELKNFDLSSVRTILYGAAPMPRPLLRRGLDLLGPVFIQTYGQTETVGTSLARHEHCPDGSEEMRKRLSSVGRPYVNTELKIVDSNDLECPAGSPGEVVVRSSAQFSGYWNNSSATLEALRDGWVYTGDIGKLDSEGFLYLVDRKKDVIISGGENIYSREVEEAILQHSAVNECAVIGVPDEKWGEAVCAVIVLNQGYSVSEQELIEHCKTVIASYKKPKMVIFASSIPKLPSGKVSKVELRNLYINSQ